MALNFFFKRVKIKSRICLLYYVITIHLLYFCSGHKLLKQDEDVFSPRIFHSQRSASAKEIVNLRYWIDSKPLSELIKASKHEIQRSYESTTKHIVSFIDKYVPRQISIKLVNYMTSYDLNLTLNERRILLESIDSLNRDIDATYRRRSQEDVLNDLSEHFRDDPFLQTVVDFLSLIFLHLSKWKPDATTLKTSWDTTSSSGRNFEEKATARQTPFGIVNFFIASLADPIVLGLVVTLTVSNLQLIIYYPFFNMNR